jgi:hypothetical protein
MLHELWEDGDDEGSWTFCLAGPMGDGARARLGPRARLVWAIEAENHFDAMTRYYEHMGWGVYTTDHPEIDRQSYADRGWS